MRGVITSRNGSRIIRSEEKMGGYGERQRCQCKTCGTQFMLRPSYIKKKNYCSDRCRQSDLICACDYCGKEMMIKPSYRKLKNYCSEECKERAGYNCRCDYCGKEYKAEHINQTFNYCSEKCKEEANLNCVCEQCSKRFHRAPFKIKSKTFCSPECQKKSEKKHYFGIATCLYCGKEFQETRERPNKFCSNRCSGKYYGEIKRERCRSKREQKEQEKRKKKEMISELKQGIKELKARIKEIERYRECQCCGKMFRSEKNRSYCSEKCSRRADNRRRDKRIYQNGKPDLSITLDKLYKRDKGICKLCGKPTYFVDDIQADIYPSIDHIIPISKGGLHRWNNVQLAHRGCNTDKGNDLPRPRVFV